jgi:hypothetical protein
MGTLRLASGIRVEEIEDEILILDAESAEVHRLTGASAATLRRVRSGGARLVDLAKDEVTAAQTLLTAGIIEEPGAAAIDRRQVLRTGVMLAAVGAATLALPRAAAAATGDQTGAIDSFSASRVTQGTNNGDANVTVTYSLSAGNGTLRFVHSGTRGGSPFSRSAGDFTVAASGDTFIQRLAQGTGNQNFRADDRVDLTLLDNQGEPLDADYVILA